MALRRFLTLLRIRASSHGRRAVAATAARGAQARACAVARYRAIRTEGELASAAALAGAEARARAARDYLVWRLQQAGAASAVARFRSILVEGELASTATLAGSEARARAARTYLVGRLREAGAASAVARFRAIRAEGEVTATAALASAEARARAAHAYLIDRLQQAGAASAAAQHLLRQASDSTVTIFLRLAYGQSAPRTPSPMEMLPKLAQLAELISDMAEFMSHVDTVLELFNEIIPIEAGILLAVLLMPVAAYYKDIISSAPEVVCPFLGITALEFDSCPVEEGLVAVFTLSARCGGMVILVIGALIISAFIDLGAFAIGMIGDAPEDISDDSVIALTHLDGETLEVHHISWGAAR